MTARMCVCTAHAMCTCALCTIAVYNCTGTRRSSSEGQVGAGRVEGGPKQPARLLVLPSMSTSSPRRRGASATREPSILIITRPSDRVPADIQPTLEALSTRQCRPVHSSRARHTPVQWRSSAAAPSAAALQSAGWRRRSEPPGPGPASLRPWREPNVRPELTKYPGYVTAVRADSAAAASRHTDGKQSLYCDPIGALYYPSELRDKD